MVTHGVRLVGYTRAAGLVRTSILDEKGIGLRLRIHVGGERGLEIRERPRAVAATRYTLRSKPIPSWFAPQGYPPLMRSPPPWRQTVALWPNGSRRGGGLLMSEESLQDPFLITNATKTCRASIPPFRSFRFFELPT